MMVLSARMKERLQKYGTIELAAGAGDDGADFLFIPSMGPHANQRHLIEVKDLSSHVLPDTVLYSALQTLRRGG